MRIHSNFLLFFIIIFFWYITYLKPCQLISTKMVCRMLLVVFSFIYRPILASQTNFQVKTYKLCNNTQGLLKYHGNITKENGVYYGSGILLVPIPLDENIGFTCKIESLMFDKYVELFTIREKDLCKAANIYLSEFWYDIERAAQIIPKTCPLPPRRFEIHHVKLDFGKVGLQTFSFGYLKFTAKAVDNKYPHNNIFCIELEVENVPN